MPHSTIPLMRSINILTAPRVNGEGLRSVFSLTLSGGFNVVSIFRLALSRFAVWLHRRLLILISAFPVFDWLCQGYTMLCDLSSKILTHQFIAVQKIKQALKIAIGMPIAILSACLIFCTAYAHEIRNEVE